MNKRILTHRNCEEAAHRMRVHVRSLGFSFPGTYGVPRGGVPVAYLLGWPLESDPSKAVIFVDDVIDSCATKSRYVEEYDKPFFALSEFLDPPKQPGEWLVFPWEQGEEGNDQSATDCVVRLLQYIGEDPNRGGLKETPERVLKAWKEWTSGYERDPAEVFKSFQDGGESYDEMIWERNLPFYSHCEHHLAPFFGTVTISYIPNGSVVGLSKLGRVVEVFARRLQVQERMTVQIADAIQTHLKPKGVGVVVKARHLCMESRGYNRQGQDTVTSALRGVFRDQPEVRQEFLSLLNGK